MRLRLAAMSAVLLCAGCTSEEAKNRQAAQDERNAELAAANTLENASTVDMNADDAPLENGMAPLDFYGEPDLKRLKPRTGTSRPH